MQTTLKPTTNDTPVAAPLGEAEIRARLEAERERLEREAGLKKEPVTHYRRPVEAPFTKSERGQVTILFGGLTELHERLAQSGLRALGYKALAIPTPVKADFQAGKEYGNNGQCNPTYFTVGALVNYLKDLRDNKGLSTEQILRDYVYITAGACGPCRFGMYESEYRIALRNSGFDGFRVLLFQQQGGLDQAAEEAGIEFNLEFFLMFLNAIFIGDLLNAVGYQIRPYETTQGKTNEVIEKCFEIITEALSKRYREEAKAGAMSKLLATVAPGNDEQVVAAMLDQIRGDWFTSPLERCRELIQSEVEVDFLRAKPITKITGEFWAQTTEGDGNFRMFPFLESENSEVLVEPIATWVDYLLHQNIVKLKDSKGLDAAEEAEAKPGFSLVRWFKGQKTYYQKLTAFKLAKGMLHREYKRYREALGGTVHELADQPELTRIAHPFYNSRSAGGEGHLEVAKNIYYTNKDYAHMVLSLKPFGCMPSTQSDGAQAAVVSRFSDIIYLPVETSGEGDINAYSRVQMALGEAKVKAQKEFKAALEKAGVTVEELRAYIAEHPELKKPLQHVPHTKGIVGKAANFALHVAALMKKDSSRLEAVGA